MQGAIQEFTIGFFDSSGVFSVYAKQDDTERFIKFCIIDREQEYTSLLNTENLRVFVREELPDGGALPDIEIDSSYIDAANSTVTVPITADMLRIPGTAVCDLLFMERVGDKEFRLLSTTRFKLIIVDNVGTPQSGITKEWFDNWTELYVELETLRVNFDGKDEEWTHNEETRIDNENKRISAENIRESRVQEQVDEAHMWANGNTQATDPDDTPSLTNNSKYYCQKAQGYSIQSEEALERTLDLFEIINFEVDFSTGELMYNPRKAYSFNINTTSGELEWEAIV
jgi:hypothetical protein